jgi:hypothetical protein
VETDEERLRVLSCSTNAPSPGIVEAQKVAIEYRSAEDHLDRLPALVPI